MCEPQLLQSQKVKVLVAHLSPTLWPLGLCNPQGSSFQGAFQARILEWVAIPFYRGRTDPGIELTQGSNPGYLDCRQFLYCLSQQGSQGRKANLLIDMQSWGLLKYRKKLGMFRLAHCSFYLLCSQERERKQLLPLFFLFTATAGHHKACVWHYFPGRVVPWRQFLICLNPGLPLINHTVTILIKSYANESFLYKLISPLCQQADGRRRTVHGHRALTDKRLLV